jgi:GTPase
LVFNKIDAYTFTEKDEDDLSPVSKENYSLEDLKRTWMSKLNNTRCVFISAQNKENVEELKEIIYKEVKEVFKVRYPYNDFLY